MNTSSVPSPTSPGVSVQTPMNDSAETYPFLAKAAYLFSYTIDGVATLVLGRPIVMSAADKDAGTPITLFVESVSSDHKVHEIEVLNIDGVFPSHVDGHYFIEHCRLAGSTATRIHALLSDYMKTSPDGIEGNPIFQTQRVKELEALTSVMKWASNLPAFANFGDSERAVVRACVDRAFESITAHIKHGAPEVLGPIVRAVILDMLDIDPDTKSQWVDAVEAAGELKRLRSDLQNANNQLAMEEVAPVVETAPLPAASIEAFQLTTESRANNSNWPTWMHKAWSLDPDDIGAVSPKHSPTSDEYGILALRTDGGAVVVNWSDWILNSDGTLFVVSNSDLLNVVYIQLNHSVRHNTLSAVASFHPGHQKEPNAEVTTLEESG